MPGRNHPNYSGVAPHSALVWTNTHEEHWPGGGIKEDLGVIMPYALVQVVIKQIVPSWALPELTYPK